MTLVIGFAFLFVGFTCWCSGWAIGRALLARTLAKSVQLVAGDRDTGETWKT